MRIFCTSPEQVLSTDVNWPISMPPGSRTVDPDGGSGHLRYHIWLKKQLDLRLNAEISSGQRARSTSAMLALSWSSWPYPIWISQWLLGKMELEGKHALGTEIRNVLEREPCVCPSVEQNLRHLFSLVVKRSMVRWSHLMTVLGNGTFYWPHKVICKLSAEVIPFATVVNLWLME